MRTKPQVKKYDDIVSERAIVELRELASYGATSESLTREIIDRVVELKPYPAYARMTKLNELWRDCVVFANLHCHELIVATAMRRLNPAR